MMRFLLSFALVVTHLWLQDAGCKAILVGESLVKQDDIEGAVKQILS